MGYVPEVFPPILFLSFSCFTTTSTTITITTIIIIIIPSFVTMVCGGIYIISDKFHARNCKLNRTKQPYGRKKKWNRMYKITSIRTTVTTTICNIIFFCTQLHLLSITIHTRIT